MSLDREIRQSSQAHACLKFLHRKMVVFFLLFATYILVSKHQLTGNDRTRNTVLICNVRSSSWMDTLAVANSVRGGEYCNDPSGEDMAENPSVTSGKPLASRLNGNETVCCSGPISKIVGFEVTL